LLFVPKVRSKIILFSIIKYERKFTIPFLFFLGKGEQSTVGLREHATALFMACKHLPMSLLSPPGIRAGMLAEAARTLEKIGDRKNLMQCYKLLKSITTNSSVTD